MTINGVLQIILYLVLLILLAKPLGSYMARVYEGERTLLDPVLQPLERLLYRLLGVRLDAARGSNPVAAAEEMRWQTYAVAMLLFSVVSFVFLYVLQRIQALLPLNPAGMSAISPDSSFNTAVSFVSNTNWQGYGGESTMSYLTQMVGLTVQNFVSAAAGMAMLVALIRGLVPTPPKSPPRGGDLGGVGNFWVDMTRSTLYILLPWSIVLAVLLVSQGVVQTMMPYQTVALLQPTIDGDGNAIPEQVLALGPAASQIAIKQLGTNGGGFFNVNSAHPFENATPFSNLLQMLSILLIPAALCYTFGKMVGDTRQGWALLAAMTIILVVFLFGAYAAEAAGNPRLAVLPYSLYSVATAGQGTPITITVLIALLVCLIPTTIGGLLSAIGIAGMDRMIQRNVIAMSGRAVEAAGDVDVLLLDKTGTITLGNRQAVEFVPVGGVTAQALADAAQLASLADETPEGRSIVVLAKEQYGLRGRTLGDGADGHTSDHHGMSFVPFTAQTRMSGVDMDGVSIRKGAPDTIMALVQSNGNSKGSLVELQSAVDAIARNGGTPLVVARNGTALGVIHLKDIVKGGIKERFAHLRKMGIKTVMITGDNPLTAAAIAAEAGVNDFLAQATPEAKLKLIREYQTGGRLVAMTGDGTNDAPALAQADVAVAMNTGTQPAREAANMVDLDSNPTKLIEIVEIGKQLLMTRGALATFSIASDVAKYFAIIPAAFTTTYPALSMLNFMRLATPESAILSAVIFNALIIVALIPLALRGVPYRPVGAAQLLRDNLLIYGVGGLIAPFIGIKVIDLLLVALRLA